MKFKIQKLIPVLSLFVFINSFGAPMDNLLNINLKTVNGTSIKLSDYKNTKVFLIVNTASQYEGLEALHKKFKDKGLAVIGFPSNDFGAQEPGTNEQIKDFCKLNFGVSFPLITKAEVTGSEIQPFYKELLNLSSDKSAISWNFEKFLITKDGNSIQRFKSKVKPEDLESIIVKLL
jgi:glutathione peroxidase